MSGGVLVWLPVWGELQICILTQLTPLPHTVSCLSKIQIGFTFLVPAHLGSPGQRAVKWVFYYVPVNRFFLTVLPQFIQNENCMVREYSLAFFINLPLLTCTNLIPSIYGS